MGFFPCSNHRKKFRGAAQHAYPALVEGNASERAHLRLCEDCFADYQKMLGATLTMVQYESEAPDAPAHCWQCDSRAGLNPVFVNSYPKGSEETDWFGHTCRECKEALAIRLLVK